MADYHQDWTMRIDFLGHTEVTDAVIGYQVCHIILWNNNPDRIMSLRNVRSYDDKNGNISNVTFMIA